MIWAILFLGLFWCNHISHGAFSWSGLLLSWHRIRIGQCFWCIPHHIKLMSVQLSANINCCYFFACKKTLSKLRWLPKWRRSRGYVSASLRDQLCTLWIVCGIRNTTVLFDLPLILCFLWSCQLKCNTLETCLWKIDKLEAWGPKRFVITACRIEKTLRSSILKPAKKL